METKKQHELLSLVRDKLIKHFNFPEEDHDQFEIVEFEDGSCVLFMDWHCSFSIEGDDLGVSFDLDAVPDVVAEVMYSLLRNNINVQVMENCYHCSDGVLYWGDEAFEKQDEDTAQRLKQKNKMEGLH